MWFLRVCLFFMALVWGRLAWQGVNLIEGAASRVGEVDPTHVIYVVGIPAFASAALGVLLLGTWRFCSRRFLATAAVAAWLSFALFWPYGIVLTSGF